jgi:undecaprenyl-diphosphatase
VRVRTALSFAFSGVAVGGFVMFANELGDGHVPEFDHTVLRALEDLRTPRRTETALDVTALGSGTLLVFFGLIALVTLLRQRARMEALQLAVSSAGAIVLTHLLKGWVDRVRPVEVSHVIEVSGFSYPSGHSFSAAAFYTTLAVVVGSRTQSHRLRVLLGAIAILVIVLVALSRQYMGVHYPSDTIAGVGLGVAWALFIAVLFAHWRHSRTVAAPTAPTAP